MDLREETLKEHSKRQAVKMAAWIGSDDSRFSQLIDIFLHDEYRVVQRICSVLSKVADSQPEMVEKHIGVLIKRLDDKDVHVALRRNVMRIMQFLNIPKKHHARLFNKSISYMCDPNETIGVRCFSMTVATNLAKQYPELAGEVKETINISMKNSTAGYRARARRELKELEKLSRIAKKE